MNEAQIVPCPGCGAQYPLTAEYLAQYGGQQTQCSQCRQMFIIPAVVGTVPVTPFSTTTPVIGYMSPFVATPGVWRDGKLLVAAKGAVLPERCVKCNVAVDELPRLKKFRWVSPWWLFLMIGGAPGMIGYLIVTLTTQKTGEVHYSVCRRHRAIRMGFIIGGVFCIPFAIALMMVGVMGRNRGYLIWVALILVVLGLFISCLAGRIVYPRRIDEHYVVLRGAGAEFLNTLHSV